MPPARRRRRQAQIDDLIDFAEDEDPVGTLINRAMAHPQIQGLVSEAREALDKFGYVIDRAARRPVPNQAPRVKARPRRAVIPPPDPLVFARATLMFGPGDKLTKEMVRKRRKEMAAMYHPDRGGNDEWMRKINAAADALLAVL